MLDSWMWAMMWGLPVGDWVEVDKGEKVGTPVTE